MYLSVMYFVYENKDRTSGGGVPHPPSSQHVETLRKKKKDKSQVKNETTDSTLPHRTNTE